MDLTRAYHISDIHIRLYNRLDEYEVVFEGLYRFLEAEKEEGAKGVIVITGDVLHHKNELSPECIVFTRAFFLRLSSIFPVVVIAGNHDALLNNKNRMDSLSAILAPSCPGVSYWKETGFYRFGNVNFGVHSLLDNGHVRASECPYVDGKRIALYHGGVGRFSTNKGYVMEGIPLSTFDGYDMVMLGDIHLFQYLDARKRVAYAGSLISQNHTETDPRHGVLVWDLETCESELVVIDNPYAFREAILDAPFLDYEGRRLDLRDDSSLSILPSRARLSLVLSREKTAEDIHLIRAMRDRAPGVHIVEKPVLRAVADTTGGDEDRQGFSETEMITAYMDTLPDTWTDIQKERILRILETSSRETRDATGSWEIVEVRFDNMFGYGKGNRLDVSRFPLHETVGVFGENSAGKSSIIEIIVFLLYGQITRYAHGASVPREIIRFGETESSGSIRIRVKGITYEIDKRMTLQKKTQKIRVEEKLWRILEDGTREDCSEEHRKKTDRFIAGHIGPCSQFLFTSVFLQQNEESFRSLSPKDRKEFLFQILDLKRFEDMYAEKTEEYKMLKKELDMLEKEMRRLPGRDDIRGNMERCDNLIGKLAEESASLEGERALRAVRIETITAEKKPCPFANVRDGMASHREALDAIESARTRLRQCNEDREKKKRAWEARRQRWESNPLSSVDLEASYQEKWDALEILYKKRLPEPAPIASPPPDEDDEEEDVEGLARLREECVLRLRPEPAHAFKKLETTRATKMALYTGNEEELRSEILRIEEDITMIATEWEADWALLEEMRARCLILETRQDQVSCLASDMRFVGGCGACDHNHSLMEEHLKVRQEWTGATRTAEELATRCGPPRDEYIRLSALLEDKKRRLQEQEAIGKDLRVMEDVLHNRKTRTEIQALEARIRKSEEARQRNRLRREHAEREQEIRKVRFLNTHIEKDIAQLKNRLEDIREARMMRDEVGRFRLEATSLDAEIERRTEEVVKAEVEERRVAEWLVFARDNAVLDEEMRSLLKKDQEAASRLAELARERMSVEYELTTWKERSEIQGLVSEEYDRVASETQFLQMLLRVIGRDGIQLFLVERYLPLIQEQMNAIIGPFLRGKTLSLRSDRKKENVNIHLYLCTEEQESVYVGGMEGFVIDAALKIVFARLTPQFRSNIFIIDEGISALDKKNMENLDQFFAFLEQFFPHVFIISHLREVHDHVRNSIHVMKESSMSRLVYSI